MPKETFFNLPEEKRERILMAVVKEISRVPIDKISINKIIHDAEISRGSFYQYFIDKDDVIKYVTYDYIKNIRERVVESFRASEGDVFKAVEIILRGTMEYIIKSGNINFSKNILIQIKTDVEKNIDLAVNSTDCILKIFKENMDISKLKEKNNEAIDDLLQMIFSIFKETVTRIFYDINNAELEYERFVRQIEIIKWGAIKEIK